MKSHKLSPEDALPFMLAGKALFTILKTTTEGRFTYKVGIPNDQKPETAAIHFVSVLTGSDNTSDYSYIGFIKKIEGKYQFFYGSKSRISSSSPSVQVFSVIFNYISDHNDIPKNIEIWHEGKCGRCGRTLTVPESIENGIGPECARIQGKFKSQLSLAI